MRLYPKVVVEGQSFKHCKKLVTPNQSMTLQEIIRRFIKKEALPVSHEGTYEDRYDIDLEKLQHEDLTVKDEVLQVYRDKVKTLDAKVKSEEKEKQTAMQKAAADQRAKLLEELRQSTTLNPQTVKE